MPKKLLPIMCQITKSPFLLDSLHALLWNSVFMVLRTLAAQALPTSLQQIVHLLVPRHLINKSWVEQIF